MEPREFKITFMLSLVLGYFCVEMFVGYRYNSLALVADACHMLSDGLCLVVALGTVFLTDKTCPFLQVLDQALASRKNEHNFIKPSENLVQSFPKSGKKIKS